MTDFGSELKNDIIARWRSLKIARMGIILAIIMLTIKVFIYDFNGYLGLIPILMIWFGVFNGIATSFLKKNNVIPPGKK